MGGALSGDSLSGAGSSAAMTLMSFVSSLPGEHARAADNTAAADPIAGASASNPQRPEAMKGPKTLRRCFAMQAFQ
jgi:hypothetical protein